jgi:hypothetical protein
MKSLVINQPTKLLLLCALCVSALPVFAQDRSITDAPVASLRMLPLDADAWSADPLAWRFAPDGITCGEPSAHNAFAVFAGAPLSERVAVEAVFTPHATPGRGWCAAAVALVDDARNFWHLALVRSPAADGGRHWVELHEMRGGEWHAERNLRVEFAHTGPAHWESGAPYRLSLAMDAGGVTGEITGPKGELLLRRRVAFSAPAVTRARPALRTSGFAGEFRDLRAAWGAPVPPAPGFPAYDAPPNVPAARGRATGFFRVEQAGDGRWCVIDPLGRGMIPLGTDHVSFQGHWCEKLGYAPHGRKNKEKYTTRAAWEEETLARLRAWGFNLFGAGCDPALRRRGLAHTEFLGVGVRLAGMGGAFDITPDRRYPGSAFPNVFHPLFEAHARHVAREKCAPSRGDPWLFGYFIDNELAWWGRDRESEEGLFDAVMGKDAAHTAKLALRDFVESRFAGDIGAFNTVFGTALGGFDEIPALASLPGDTEARSAVKRGFLALAAERYFSVIARAIREADPDHLVLGARFAGTNGAPPVVWEIAGRHCDVVTFNFYPMSDLDTGCVLSGFDANAEPVAAHFARQYALARRPLLVTEWSFPALDSGLPCRHGAGQRFRTQAQRAEASRLFARELLAMPFMLGYSYFMWVDQPALGISAVFPEDSNYGLINENGRPYAALTEMFAALHRDAAALRLAPPRLAAARRAPPEPAALVTRLARTFPGADATPAAVAGATDAISPLPTAARVEAGGGGAFSACNNRIALHAGGTGGRDMVARVALADGRAVGRYNAMIRTRDAGGANRWTATRRVLRTECVAGPAGSAVLTLTAAGGARDEEFEVRHRLWLPAGGAWFVAEIASVKNTGAAPLRLKGVYFRLHTAFNETPPPAAPNLWGEPPAGCWFEPGGRGLFFGAVAPRGGAVRVNFWADAGGGQHPDARVEFRKPLVLAPGEEFRPDAPAYIVCATGSGGAEAWRVALDSAIRAMEN